jgi:hypothetical protein
LGGRAVDREDWPNRARALAGRLDGHRAYLAELHRRAATGPAPRFSRVEEQWEHGALVDLVTGLEVFEKTTIPAMERRVAFARSVREKTLVEPASTWRRAIESIANPSECPRRDVCLLVHGPEQLLDRARLARCEAPSFGGGALAFGGALPLDEHPRLFWPSLTDQREEGGVRPCDVSAIGGAGLGLTWPAGLRVPRRLATPGRLLNDG